MTGEEQATLYEKGLRPAIDYLLPFDKNDWPATYEGEVFRAANRGGGISYQTKEVNELVVPDLIGQIRMELEQRDVEWGNGAFVIHMVRGTKASTKHSVSQAAADYALEQYLDDMDIRIMDEDIAYVDIGLEAASSIDNCLQWLTTSHCHLLQSTLGIDQRHAVRISTLGSTKYSRDISSHLPQLSGCRVEPGTRAEGQYRAVYYQQYTSEKSLTYNPGKGYHGKSITMKEAMGKKQPCDFASDLYQTYLDAMDNNASSARLEVRVPVRGELVAYGEDEEEIYAADYGSQVLTSISNTILKRSLVSYSKETWW